MPLQCLQTTQNIICERLVLLWPICCTGTEFRFWIFTSGRYKDSCKRWKLNGRRILGMAQKKSKATSWREFVPGIRNSWSCESYEKCTFTKFTWGWRVEPTNWLLSPTTIAPVILGRLLFRWCSLLPMGKDTRLGWYCQRTDTMALTKSRLCNYRW